MKIKFLLLAFAIFIANTLFGIQRINLSNYGINNVHDATPIITNILKTINADSVLIDFPEGKYHFYPDQAFGKYHSITNHDNSYKYFAFPIINCKNIEFNGHNSEFIFHGLIVPFLIENSTNITIRNIELDWEQPFYLQASILSSNLKEGSIKVKINPFTPAKLIGTNISFSTNGVDYPNLGENIIFDPKTNAVAYNAQSMLLDAKYSSLIATQTGNNEYNLKGKFVRNVPDSGLVYIFKGPNTLNRMAPAFHLKASKNVILDNVTIHHAAGMGVIAEKTENITLNKVNVMLKKGTDRFVTTTADATHFCNCKGNLLIQNCLFENMQDDATNIHGTYLKINEIKDKYTLVAGLKHFQQFDYQFAECGDTINFVDGKTLLPIASSVIKSVQYINSSLSEFTFEKPLPTELNIGDALDNISWYPNTIFRNNTIRNNRARGILISSRNKTIIENNNFSSMMMAILFEGDLDYWYESGACNDVLIKNNYFGDNLYGGSRGAVIFINPRMEKTIPDHPFEKNIRIIDNIFNTYDNPILNAQSVENLVFENNKIIQSKTYVPLNPNKPSIELTNCLNASIKHNSYQGNKAASIVIDKNSVNGLQIDSNQSGLKIEYKDNSNDIANKSTSRKTKQK